MAKVKSNILEQVIVTFGYLACSHRLAPVTKWPWGISYRERPRAAIRDSNLECEIKLMEFKLLM